MRENQQRRLPLVNEVVGALAAQECAHNAALDKAVDDDPKSALKRAIGLGVSDGVNLRTVRNTAREVNIAIPAYPGIDAASAKVALSDDDMRQVAAGEVFVATIVGAALVGGVIVTTVVVNSVKKGKR